MTQQHKKQPLDKEEEVYTDFSNVETMRNFVAPEPFPEGPYGAPRGENEPVVNKTTPWEEGQRYYSAYNYENKSLHADIPRGIAPSHPAHDDPNRKEEPPYGQDGSDKSDVDMRATIRKKPLYE
ncbi:cytosolic protein [Bacillus fonticola]|uniref:cytosolic protein n=1 Tax=Bacillus fonticola TaxID=2728853 RepID=UPI00147603AC|nr:cytosolic protein [Bacillus fonticola]